MKIDRNTLLFFDASCLIAAAGSPSGGSGFLLSLCARQLLQGVVSQPVLLEAQRNIQTKLGNEAINAFNHLLINVPFILAPVPPKSELEKCGEIVGEKDAHVLASALAYKVPFLLTLDKRLALQVNHAKLTVQALSPGEFIKMMLPHHPDFPKDRD